MSNSLAEWSGKILNLNPNSQKRLVLTIAFPTITTSIQMSKKRFLPVMSRTRGSLRWHSRPTSRRRSANLWRPSPLVSNHARWTVSTWSWPSVMTVSNWWSFRQKKTHLNSFSGIVIRLIWIDSNTLKSTTHWSIKSKEMGGFWCKTLLITLNIQWINFTNWSSVGFYASFLEIKSPRTN